MTLSKSIYYFYAILDFKEFISSNDLVKLVTFKKI